MDHRIETDGMGEVKVPADRLWGAQTQRALEYFDIGDDPMPREMVVAYALLKKACARANEGLGLLDGGLAGLIVAACDEILAGRHQDMFPLRVWMAGSGTQFNMNVNEVISNRCCQMSGTALGSKRPVHPNDHANMCQSTNDTFPAAMHVAAAQGVAGRLLPAVGALRESLESKARDWAGIVKIGRTHLQDATPLTLGQEFSGYAAMLSDNEARLARALEGVMPLALGGTAVGTGVNAAPGFAEAAVAGLAGLTGLPFTRAPNLFAAQGSHDALAHLSSAIKILAASLAKIAGDIRLLSCGPRAGIGELVLPANEPGSSIMPGKVNPTQCEAVTMVACQVMAADAAVAMGTAGGMLEMNAYKPLIIFNVLKSVRLLADCMDSFRRFLVEGMRPDARRIRELTGRSLMLATALTPVIGYDKAARIVHHAVERDLSLREAALELGLVDAETFDRVVDPAKMV